MGQSTFLCQIFADRLLDAKQQKRCYRDKHSLISSPGGRRRDRQLRIWLQNNVSTRSYESRGRTVGGFGLPYWGIGTKSGNEDILVKRTECVQTSGR